MIRLRPPSTPQHGEYHASVRRSVLTLMASLCAMAGAGEIVLDIRVAK